MSKLTVGQELLYVPAYHRKKPRMVKVIKVGRRWATLDNRSRIDMQTLEADGGDYSSPGRCYNSPEEYEEHLRLYSLYGRLKDGLGWIPRVGVTSDDVLQAAKLLRVGLSKGIDC